MDWRSVLRKTVVAGQFSLILRMLSGLYLFRLLSVHLSEQQFGFYSWLWSLYGTTLFFDLGIGLAAQKITAQAHVEERPEELNRFLTTAFWAFSGFSLLLWLWAWMGSGLVLHLVHLPAGGDFLRSWVVFITLYAVSFPLGLFPQVLAGAQRGHWIHGLWAIATLINVVLLTLACRRDWLLSSIMSVSLGVALIPALGAMLLLPLAIRGFSLWPGWFSWGALYRQMGFSARTYSLNCGDMLFRSADQTIIGVFLGTTAVASYQAAYKLSEIFLLLWTVVHRPLGPAISHLWASSQQEAADALMRWAQRGTLWLALPTAVVIIGTAHPLLLFLTGKEAYLLQGEALVAFLLSAAFFQVYLWGPSQNGLIFYGYEGALARSALIGAALNIALSCLGAVHFGLLGVAAATLAATVFRGFLVWRGALLPFLRRSGWSLVKEARVPGLCLVCLFLAGLCFVNCWLGWVGLAVYGLWFLGGQRK